MLIGIGCIAGAVRRKLNFPLLAFGMLFAGVASYVWTTNAISTWQCHSAASKGEGVFLTGTVSSVEATIRKGERSVSFNIGGARVSTATYGLNSDCGFIDSAGKTYSPKEGHVVEALLFNGHLIKLKVVNTTESNQQQP
ncbi:MAG: hypothetical protein SF172_01055 [Burkholderiales bacterium]|nr:hypothetical protein [Burkholderiales bacterium]